MGLFDSSLVKIMSHLCFLGIGCGGVVKSVFFGIPHIKALLLLFYSMPTVMVVWRKWFYGILILKMEAQ